MVLYFLIGKIEIDDFLMNKYYPTVKVPNGHKVKCPSFDKERM